MSAPGRDGSSGEQKPPERVGDALRTAVERTLAASAGPATETRQRARGLLDQVARRGERARDEVARRGEAAREEVTRRGEAARDQVTRTGEAARQDLARRGEEAGGRLAEAIAELKPAERGDPGDLTARVEAIERRLGELERAVAGSPLDQAKNPSESHPQVESEQTPEMGGFSGG